MRRAGALNRGATNEVIVPVDLIDHLFSGLAERPVWQTFLQRLAERLGAKAAALIISPPGRPPEEGAVLCPIGLQEQFTDLIGAPVLEGLPLAEPRLLAIDNGRHASWDGSAALRLSLDQQHSVWLVVRPIEPGADLATDWHAVLTELTPFLVRIMRAYLVLAESERRRLIAEYALESSETGVILVDEDSSVMHINAVASEIIADTQLLGINGGRLFARHPVDQQVLKQHVRTKAREQSATSRPDCYATMALSRHDHHLPVTAVIRPGPPYAPISAPLRRTAVIVLRDPARRNNLDAADLERLFGLTPAEARLARLLAEGISTEDAAVALGVSKHTIRSQLQAVFLKTGTNRQGELVRTLLNSAAALARNPARGGETPDCGG
ncbi:MAG: helix-turn-helix transcriptional regulator [Proteobacteria bacterium]|nr:helix-turn-helix transcriptional regulator [Pseudomonadota bacterium]